MAEKSWEINDSIPIALSVGFDPTTSPFEAITSMSATVVVTTSLFLTMSVPELQMTGSQESYAFTDASDVVGSLSLELKPPILLMSGGIEARGGIILTMSPPELVMTGDQFSAVRYTKGIVMNMSHFGVADYIGYDFNSVTYFNGKFLGGNSQGVFVFGGNKDNGQNINVRIKMPVLDAYENILRKVRDARLTCRTDGQMMLVVQLGEDQFYDDVFEPTDRALQYRWKFPKGFKERFQAFELRNVDGSDFDINNLRFTTDTVPGREK